MKRLKFGFLIIGFSFLILPFLVLALPVTEYSNVFKIKTLPLISSSPVFLCRTTSESSINLSWLWSEISFTSTLTLYYSTSTATSSRSVLASNLSPNQGSYDHTGLKPFTSYYYWLETSDGSISIQTSCLTPVGVPQDPSNLEVITLGPTELYLTWKDNAVRPHDFVVERIKVTPASTTDLAVTVNGNNVTISWKNLTDSQPYKSPFYHVIELSNSPDFNQNNTSLTYIYFNEDITYQKENKVNYNYTQHGIINGTYYYRVKACSFIKTAYDSCGEAITTGPVIVTEKPSQKSFFANLIEQISNWFNKLFNKAKTEKASAQVSFEPDNEPIYDINVYFDQFKRLLSFENNPSVYRDSNLEPDTVYLYRVKTVYRSGGETSYSEEAAGKTLKSGNTQQIQLKVCVRNSLCAPVTAYDLTAAPSLEPQCNVNNDCRDVGTSRKFFEETR